MKYKHIITNEVVEDYDAEKYVLDKLGLTVTPKGESGELTKEQQDNIRETIDWFFSGNWIKEDK